MSAVLEVLGAADIPISSIVRECGVILQRLLNNLEIVPVRAFRLWPDHREDLEESERIAAEHVYEFSLMIKSEPGGLIYSDHSSIDGSVKTSIVFPIGGGAGALSRCVSVALAISVSRFLDANILDVQGVLSNRDVAASSWHLEKLALKEQSAADLITAADDFWANVSRLRASDKH